MLLRLVIYLTGYEAVELVRERSRSISQAFRQLCCRGACQILERLGKSKLESRGFETSRHLAVRRPSAY